MSGAGDDTPPWLSVVIAVRAADGRVDDCLAAVEAQSGDDVEIIVVSDRELDLDATAERELIVSPGAVVPELWATGVRAARGRHLGLLASTVVPAPDWVELTRTLHKSGDAAVGGPIEPSDALGPVGWAVYFCRYSPYMRPLETGRELEVAADNASYSGEILRRYAATYSDGFWEPFVHGAMRRDGCALTMSEDRVVHHSGRVGAAAFCRLRFRHGREHGRRASAVSGRGRLLARAAASPAVPLVMTARAARTVFGKRRHRWRFAAVSPIVLLFYVCWAAGEAVGFAARVVSPARS